MRMFAIIPAVAMLVVAASPAEGQRRDRSVITQDEIDRSGAQSVYQAVRKLRPVWLSSRGAVSLRPSDATMTGAAPVTKEDAMVIYVDGVRRGGMDELRMFPIEQVRELRFYSVDEATTRFGTGHPFGAIDVLTRN